MINGVHALLFARDPGRALAFLAKKLDWPHVDAGDGRLIFAMPPAELGVHETDGDGGAAELYLMCDDVEKTVAELKRKRVKVTKPVADRGWGLVTAIEIPGFGEMGLYQPRHAVAAKLTGGAAKKRRPPAARRRKR
jgi:hypothetical protein